MNKILHGALLTCLVLVPLGAKAWLEKNPLTVRKARPPVDASRARQSSDAIKKYHLGFANLLAALSWVQLLQESSHEALKGSQVSWEFTHLDEITSLDPNFQRAYSFGSVFLSVFKRDNLGAKILLEKWVKRFPISWQAHYLLGYHLAFEMNDSQAGSRELLIASGLNGAPAWLSSLGIRLLSETGALAQALKLSVELYADVKTDMGKDRLSKRVRNLNYALQKSSWAKALATFTKERNRTPETLAEIAPYHLSEIREVASWVEIPEELVPILKERFAFRLAPDKKSIIPVETPEDLDLDITGRHENPNYEGTPDVK